MKTENFDDAIRNKIDSIQEQYTEADIDKVQAFVNQQTIVSKRRYTAAVFMAAASFLFVTLFGWSLLQYSKNNDLAEDNARLRNELNKKSYIVKEGTGDHKNEQVVLSKTDTIYITKYITVNAPKGRERDGERETRAERGTERLDDDVLEKKANSNTTAKNSGIKGKKEEKLNKGAGQSQDATGKFADKARSTKEKKSDPGIPSNTYGKQDDGIKSGNQEAVNGEKESKEKESSGIFTDKVSIANSNPSKADSLMAITKKDSVIVVPVAKNEEAKSGGDEPEIKKPKRQFNLGIKDVDFAVGLGAEASVKQFGFGLYGSMTLNSRWVLTAGIKKLNSGDERFRDPDEYHNRKKEDLRKFGQFPDSSRVFNVGIRTGIIQVPVSLAYRIPIKNDFALLLSAGTDIDLDVRQRVDYDFNMVNQPQPGRHKNLDNAPSAVAFNNAVISAGVEKQWNKISFELSPFVSPQLRKVAYKREELYAGIRGRVYYNF